MAGASFGKVLLGIAIAAAGLVAGVALLVEDGRGDVGGRDVASVVREADELLGEPVTVSGTVDDVLGAKSFTITDGPHRLLVLDVSAVPAVDNDLDGVVVDERVTVSGVLRTLRAEEVERYLGALLEQRYEPFLGEPVILADSFRPR